MKVSQNDQFICISAEGSQVVKEMRSEYLITCACDMHQLASHNLAQRPVLFSHHGGNNLRALANN